MFNSIIVAIDGSPGALDAAALADEIAEPEGVAVRAPVLAAHRWSLAAGLHEMVDARGADLLVVGAHHHARAALRELPCAVAVAPVDYAVRPDRAIRSVGVGYVDDRAGRAVLDTARGLAWQLGAEVRATTVVAPSNWEAADSGTGRKAAAAARRMAEIPGVHGAVIEGHPHRALAEISATVDLLVIGSRHHGAVWRLLLGDVTKSLSHSSRCPLVVVPSDD